MTRTQREELQALLAEAVTGLCRSSLKYANKFSVEGLLGITLDENEVLLISLKETVNSGESSGSDSIRPGGGRAIAVAKKRTAKMAGLPSFPSPDSFHRQSGADHQPSFTASTSDSNFSDFQTVTMPPDAFESSPPIKKPCRSPSIGSAGSTTPPSFTPTPTQEISFPNMTQVSSNASAQNPSNSQSGAGAWSPDGSAYRLGTISGLSGSSANPLGQEKEGFGIRRKSIQKDRHFEHFWEDFEVIYTVSKFASENSNMKLGELKDALQRTHHVALDKSTSWFAHHLRKFVFNPLTNRLYLRVDNEGFGRICVSEQELLEIITSHHSLHHEGPKKLYETLKEVYYPCNVKRFQDLFQQHVQPACSKCFLNSSTNSQSNSSWHIMETSRRPSECADMKSVKSSSDSSLGAASNEDTNRHLTMVDPKLGRAAGLLGNMTIMQI